MSIRVALRIIPVADLIPDPDVQLAFTYSERDARRIANSYDDRLVGVLAVVPLGKEDGPPYGVIDGRHRLEGVRLRGAPMELRCDVFEPGLTPAVKAGIKLGRDRNRRAVRALESFLVEVIQGDPAACEIKKLAEAAGFVIAPAKGGKTTTTYNRIEAVQTLRMIHARGVDQLKRTLDLASWWRDEPMATNSDWLAGLGQFVKEGYDLVASPSAWERIQALIPAKVVREAQALSSSAAGSWHGAGERTRLIAERLRKAGRLKAAARRGAAT